MSRFLFSLLALSLALISMGASIEGHAQIVTERQIIITPVPAAKEIIVTPAGFVNCFTVSAGWYKDTWIPEHRVCQYEASAEGVAWVEGYWACNKFTNGNCTNWEWKVGRWVKTLEVY